MSRSSHESSPLPPLPSTADYSRAVDAISAEIGETGAIGPVLAMHIHKAKPSGRFLETIAHILNPIDRSTRLPVDEEALPEIRRAVSLGFVAGSMIVERVHGAVVPVHRTLTMIELPPDIADPDELQERHLTAEALVDFGAQGVALMGPHAEDRIGDWENLAVPEVRMHRMFRTALGLAALGAHQIHNELVRKDLQQLELVLDEGPPIDWDELLK